VFSLGVALFAGYVGIDRDRAFYPTVMIVIASYYVLFAAMSDSVHTVLLESVVMTVFANAAVVGFKSSAWVVVAALAGHGVFAQVLVTLEPWPSRVGHFKRRGGVLALQTLSLYPIFGRTSSAKDAFSHPALGRETQRR
jgi:hypothetical protein